MTRTAAVIVNPLSGKGRAGRSAPALAEAMRKRGIRTEMLSGGSAEESLGLAHAAIEHGVDMLIAAGGDGTINLVVQAAAGTEVPVGIVPLGTGNDNAKMLGLDTDLDAAVDVIADFNVRTIDLGRVRTDDGTERWFMGVLSSGFDSCVNERANQMRWPKGESRYLVGILAELRTFKPLSYRLVIDGEEIRTKAMLVAVGNGTSYGGGMRVCEGARPDDGLFTITLLREVGKFEFLKVFPSVYKGTHINYPLVSQYVGTKVRLEAPDQIVYADGERIGPLPADVELFPDHLRVIAPAPPDADGGTAAADGTAATGDAGAEDAVGGAGT